MVRIISDTSTLYSSAEAREAGFHVAPLSVTIAGSSYREFDEISSDEFVRIIREGNMPVSSQPSIGQVEELFQQFPEDDIVNISMAMGLSGTYESAVAASKLCDHADRITVINSRTLCGPHRYLVEKAVEWAEAGKSAAEITAMVEEKMPTCISYLMPDDFNYLRRGGRLSPLVSYVGIAANLAPVMTTTEDGTRLVIAAVRRGFRHAVKYVGDALKRKGVGKGWRIYITHAAAPEKAQTALEDLQKVFPDAAFEIHPLSPAFITQGGPSCVAVQVVLE